MRVTSLERAVDQKVGALFLTIFEKLSLSKPYYWENFLVAKTNIKNIS
jgi:hypothetical protein